MAASAPGTSSTLAHFQATRSFFIAQGYLNFSAFQATLLAQYHNHLPHDVAEALRGLQRMSSSVNSSISVCLATHHCLTLKDVEAWILESCNDFRGLSSFDQICLGPLTKHPAVVQCFPKAHTLDARVRELTARDVLAAAAKHLRSWSVGAPSRRTATCSMATAELLHGGLSSLVEELGLQVPLGATSPTQWQRIAAELGHMPRTSTLGVSPKCSNGSPVSGEVSCSSSHRSMAPRSYVWPSEVNTGSSISSAVMGQRSSSLIWTCRRWERWERRTRAFAR